MAGDMNSVKADIVVVDHQFGLKRTLLLWRNVICLSDNKIFFSVRYYKTRLREF